MGRDRSASGLLRAAAAGLALLGTLLCASEPVVAQSRPYWLDRGREIIKCPGETAGEANKLANATGQWGEIQGVLNCIDDGANYRYELQWLSYRNNPEALGRINRGQIKFDWIGLAIYRDSAAAPGGIEWLH